MIPYRRATILWLLVLLLFLALVGCIPGQATRATSSAISTNTPARPTRIPSETPPSIRLQTPTPLVTSTAVLMQQKDEIPACMNGKEPTEVTSASKFKVEGTLLFTQRDFASIHSISGDLKSLDEIVVSGVHTHQYMGISPNGKWLAIWLNASDDNGKGRSDTIVIRLISNDGQKIETQVDLSKKLAYMQTANKEIQFDHLGGSWLNEDTLALLLSFVDNPWGSTMFLMLPAYLNPFTGEWQDAILNRLVGKDPYEDTLSWISLSPDQSRAVRTLYEGMTLWDVGQQQEIKVRGDIRSRNFRWSPDSHWAVLYDPGTETTKIIDRNGGSAIEFDSKIERESDLRVQILQHRWSPDSRLLAMVGDVEDGDPDTLNHILLVYDLAQGKYILKCFTHDPHTAPLLDWSPDGDYVALSNLLRPIRIVDIHQRVVYQLPEEGELIGWVNDFPLKNIK